ncbi:UDP-N-acetylglucosamine-peptide N-acetylglucosaminyltransferase [Ideonella sp. A 288]|uniref:O-linked N-acetylglucosamine transferase, SPINDLY family protein n=1 Tax=Ideonella sp. A 288 TaxID=1962181 RepID=UPI000B4C1C4E|nr:UDP-N-acetylglucosamine-peptide N-acetylglucosaminyltransferase [Ideonella sp. A 288]
MKHYARSRAWCEWENFDTWRPRALAALADPDAAATPPFHLLSLPGITAAEQRRCAERWMAARLRANQGDRDRLAAEFAGQHHGPGADRPTEHGTAGDSAPRRLRLGYLSGDLQQHATAWLMVEMLEAHDHARFELHAYSHGADVGGGMRQRLAAAFDGFHDIAALDDTAAARAIHADGIDILVDLKGYTAGSRTSLLTYRPAPVQVGFLGYPGTLGGDFCDYLVSDRFVTPAAAAADYSEALACLPHSYQPHGRPATVAATSTRAAAGLPDDGLVLCCFNQAFKFTPEVFGLWCTVLDQAPGSVLWLLGSEAAEGNLRREAMARGVAPHRLVFAPHLPQDEHLARLPLADLVLDTLPCNAHTTASDALWAGVPMLTCAGDTFASRVAGSLLHAVGLPELVTHSLDDYAALAVALATDAPRLAALRARLEVLRRDAPLFDVPAYTTDLESLYDAMWRRHCSGLPPQAIC